MPKTDTFYRVLMRPAHSAKCEPWTVYRDLADAITAAEGLITSDMAVESEVFAVTGPDKTTSVFHIQLDADGAILTRRTEQ